MDVKRWTMAVGMWAGIGLVPGLAQDAPAKPPVQPDGPRAQVERHLAEVFRRYDKDGDGALSLDEFMAMDRLARVPEEKRREIFHRLDKDGDGKLYPHELAAMHEGLGHGARMPRMPRLEELDLDHSGGISFEEFRLAPFVSKLPEEQQRALFKRLDRDGDGQLTAKDRPPGDGHGGHPWGPRFAALDTDHSGGVSFEEFVQAEWVKKLSPERQREMFDHLDRDHDGQLTPKDFLGGPFHGGQGGHPSEGANNGGGTHGLRLKAPERDSDGSLNFEQFRQAPLIRDLSEQEQKDLFKALDKNGDHKLESEELGEPKHDPKGKAAPDGKDPRASASAPSPAPAPAAVAPVNGARGGP